MPLFIGMQGGGQQGVPPLPFPGRTIGGPPFPGGGGWALTELHIDKNKIKTNVINHL